MTPAFSVRPATESDQEEISALVRGARLNPSSLRWERFVVAEGEDGIAGIAQVRIHRDGARELASMVVRDELRDRGIATALVDELLAAERGAVYVLVDEPYAKHFARWGFGPVPMSGLPRSMRRQYRIGRIVTSIGSLIARRKIRIVPLAREAQPGPALAIQRN